ncbi:MAG: glycine zipper domain-containing protein [Planctomycetaceae bacterium]
MIARHPLLLTHLSLIALLATLSGCAGMNHSERGALVGTTIGGLAGALIGHEAGNTGAGAILGAGAGMVAGSLAGDAEDAREERDWALSQVQQAEYQQSLAEPPLSNADLIFMAQNGLGDQVIKNAIDARGGQFDLQPTSLVQLKQNNVSDAVIAHIQTHGGRPRVTRVPPGGTTRVVYVEPYYPPPRVGWSVQLGPSCHGHHWHHHW